VHHLEVALSKRAALGLPKAGVTDTFRWVNGEGDSLSGLAIDVLGLKAEPIAEGERARASSELLCRGDGEESAMGPVAVVMSSAGWCQVHRTTVMRAIEACLEPITVRNGQPRVRVVWKTTSSRLVQDGYTVENDAGEESDTEKVLPKQLPLLDPDEESKGSVADTTEQDASKSTLQNRDLSSLSLVVRENCVLYNVSPWSNGQKTSVYCDQRDNRLMLAEMCHGKRVLDLCCYHGGFTLNAVLNGGAESCTAVDSSQDAIRALQANLSLNRVGADKVETVCSDITTFLQQSCHGNSRRWYDVVVLDPPKLAPTSSGLEKARRKYHGLNRDAIKAIEPTRGGLLLTCTCSAAMSQRDGGRYFLDMVSGAALAAGRCVTLLRVSGAASCHVQSPVAYPAGAYLSAALFYVHPK
jgi:23S rRNA G2069 N7-methylase RlmK/C1962 C5-methylase RlmI